MRFRADTTYYISGTVTAFGAIFEGGAVLKYAPGCSLMVEYAVSEETSLHRPVHFTAATDDTVGDPINLGTNTYPRPMPTGYFGAPCLWIRGAGSGSKEAVLDMMAGGTEMQTMMEEVEGLTV